MTVHAEPETTAHLVPDMPPPPPARRGAAGRLTPYLLLTPATVAILAITGWPLLQLILNSFQKYGRKQVFGAAPVFVGLANYADVLTDPDFWAVLVRTLLFAGACVLATMVLGTLIALLLTRLPLFFRILTQVGLLLAWAMPALTSTIVWGWIFDTDYGVVNAILTNWFGLKQFERHPWLIEPLSFFLVAGIIVVWGAIPFVAFTIYAGLTQVSREQIEAAQLDGAGGWQIFRHVIAPALRSLFLIATLLQIIWDLRVFTQIFALQDIGGIRAETSTLGVYIYQVSIAGGDFGVGGAIAVLTLILLMSISVVFIRRTLKEEDA